MDGVDSYNWDVAIVGAGPAGLSAALILTRCRRTVIVFDHARPRNRHARALHGYLGYDGIAPLKLRKLGRQEAAGYGALFVDAEVSSVHPVHSANGEQSGFEVRAKAHKEVRARKLLLATGVSDELPLIGGIGKYYGTSVHHCPYCDGWEHRDQRLVALGDGTSAVGLALALRTWSACVIACTNGSCCSKRDSQRLADMGISHRPETLTCLRGSEGVLKEIEFESGPSLACDAVFFQSPQFQQSPLAIMAGCQIDEASHARTGQKHSTGVSGLYVAGDVDGDVQFAIVAAAEGAIAATAINRELQDEFTEGRSHGEA